jgi:chondroitin 4-sulfotransferase 11
MPYCDEKKTIFIHTPKTGGTIVRTLLDIKKFVDENPNTIPSPQHYTCDLLRFFLGTEKYNDYYKFAFVRNPWSRLASEYFWRKNFLKLTNLPAFDEFICMAELKVKQAHYYDEPFSDHFIPQSEFVIDVDDIFKFEEFEKNVHSVAKILAIEIGAINKKPIKSHDKYWKYYDSQTKSIIAEVYAEEIERFGYEFGAEEEFEQCLLR